MTGPHHKVEASHLCRKAYLYVRQSTIRQVFENVESTKRQYALRQRAIALGWKSDQLVVIDSDQGQSGASAVDREGFQRLVADVGLGRAGIVMGLEVSRLARNCLDWHRLLEICGLTNTLILDEDGLYDPTQFNDRLLLGLKGAMSEAELHVLRARLRGGIINKARRGELETRLPAGFVYDQNRRVVLDPDTQVQDCIRLFFRRFRTTGSARATVMSFRKQDLQFPRRIYKGPNKGLLVWSELRHSRALELLHNPRYAGAFSFGRFRQRTLPGGRVRCEKLPREQWTAFVPNAHDGYISWEEFEENQKRLLDNANAYGADRRGGPAREGPALLQGLVVCGKCGDRMTVRYHYRKSGVVPSYRCGKKSIDRGDPMCQQIPGAGVDEAVGDLLLDMVHPMALEVALAVQHELRERIEQADGLRKKQVERAEYEADLARRRYMLVDPDNRLVADTLEADWNEKLRLVRQAEETYERQRQADLAVISDEQRERIVDLATDFPALWRNPKTPQRERKRMARLLIEDVTLIKEEQITAHVRFRGGGVRTLTLPAPLSGGQLRKTPPEVVELIDQLLEHHTSAEVAAILNERGLCSGMGRQFHGPIVIRIQRSYKLKSRCERLRESGMLTLDEMAERLDVCTATVQIWCRRGLLRGHRCDDRGKLLYKDPGDDAPVKAQGRKIALRHHLPEILLNPTKEVQYEA